MTIFIIIPVKKLDDAKSRLSPFLSDDERKQFCLKMLEDVLTTIKSTKLAHQKLVVSTDLMVLRVAKNFEAFPFMESRPGLNQAISDAISWCIQKGAKSTLILPADIPLVAPMDLSSIFFLGKTAAMVISPSKDENGTNALLLNPPNTIPTFYGQHSFQRYVEEASMRGISFRILRSPRIALDIDTVEDLADFVRLKAKNTQTHEFLTKINVPKRLDMYQKQ